MTAKRYFITGYGDVVDRVDRAIYPTIESMVKTMNDQDNEIMDLRAENTNLKDVVNDLKRMNTKGYVEHIENIVNWDFKGGMSEKRFKMKKLEYEDYFIDSQQEYVDEDEPDFEIDGEKTMSDSQILDLLNENEDLKQENQELKYDISILLKTHDEEKWLEEPPYGELW